MTLCTLKCLLTSNLLCASSPQALPSCLQSQLHCLLVHVEVGRYFRWLRLVLHCQEGRGGVLVEEVKTWQPSRRHLYEMKRDFRGTRRVHLEVVLPCACWCRYAWGRESCSQHKHGYICKNYNKINRSSHTSLVSKNFIHWIHQLGC